MQQSFHAKEFIQTEHLSYEDWLQYRCLGIGGSDIAAICGLSKWRTSMHVYLEKLGEAPDEVKNEAAEWGTRLEQLIAEKFSQEHPDWAILEKKVMYCHPENEWGSPIWIG
ncbi:YqaJ viral recombinase family protein [Paenibacillus sp. TC-CSREp1]|uniref:YqaJ viral recombinase family protein n=1 Tax=Paenibacillus sp. TC-CSREp1 TaxID=3410089 RepID=UPI003CFC5556